MVDGPQQGPAEAQNEKHFISILRPNRGWFFGLASVIAAGIFDQIEAPLWTRFLSLILAVVIGVIWPWIERTRRRRVMFWSSSVIYVIALVSFIAWAGPPRSVLSLNALATNITYPNQALGGIKWKDSYGDLRLSIANGAESAIQNLDLTLDVEGLVFEIGQLSSVPGVAVSPRFDFPHFQLRLRGADNSTSIITFPDDALNPQMPSDKWRLLCPRLGGKAELKLILATTTNEKIGATPNNIHVVGTYELLPSAGSRTVKVDVSVPVKR